MRNLEGNIGIKDIIVWVLFLCLLAIPIYFAYTILLPRVEIFETEEEEIEQQEEEVEIEEEYTGPHYEQLYETIEGEIAYIAVPTRIDKDNPPTIVVYSHGSNTNVTMNTEDEFMIDLQTYGELYTKDNLIFAASNQHGANWGNQTSIQDTHNMINWIKDNYDTEEKIYMIGYSMGGLPTMNFATTYPEMISKIALLAPTTRSNEWNSTKVEKIADIEIQIWHGNADVNVPYSLSTTFISKLETLGREIPLVTLDGKTHWDIDTEYMQELLDYFKN